MGVRPEALELINAPQVQPTRRLNHFLCVCMWRSCDTQVVLGPARPFLACLAVGQRHLKIPPDVNTHMIALEGMGGSKAREPLPGLQGAPTAGFTWASTSQREMEVFPS